jgi:hypothetical protein
LVAAASTDPPAHAAPPGELAVAAKIPAELRAAFARDVNDCREMAPVRDERTLYNEKLEIDGLAGKLESTVRGHLAIEHEYARQVADLQDKLRQRRATAEARKVTEAG